MKNKLHSTMLAAAIVLASAVGTAHAEEYAVSVSTGYSQAYNTPGDSKSGLASGVAVEAGFDKNFGVEASFDNFASIKSKAGKSIPQAFGFSGVFKYPVISDVTAFGKGGFAYTRFNSGASKTVPMVAAGVNYSVSKTVDAQAQIRYIHDFAGTDTRIIASEVGVKYKF